MSETSPRWSRLLQQADDPLFVLNARRRLLYVNGAWECWSGLSLKEVRGRACRISDDDHAPLFASLEPTQETLAGQWSSIRRRDATGKTTWIDIHFLPWRKDGRLLAIIGRIEPVGATSKSSAPPLPEKIVQLRQDALRSHRLELWDSDMPAVQTAVTQARLAAQIAIPALLVGPPGSGKEWLARAIHRLSSRHEEFFACLDCRLLPPSMLADLLLQPTTRLNLGALFVRHLDRLRPEMQVRLTELLAAGTLGPRLFVAFESDSDAARLPPPLVTRINPLRIALPPVRDRRGDWPRLLPEFLRRAAAIASKPLLGISPEADQALRQHDWPGNFRELEQTMRDAALRAAGERIELGDLPFEFRSEPPPQEPKLPLEELLQNAERRLLRLALDQSRQNKSKAAALLGISRPRLMRRMEQLGLADAEPPQMPTEPAGGDDAQR